MAPVSKCKTNDGRNLDSESGNNSGSDSGGESSASGSRSSSADSANQRRRSSQGSEHSKSRSPSPANSQGSRSWHSETGSQGRKSRRDSASSGSPPREAHSERSARSVSGSPGGGVERSPDSFHEKSSRSPSPDDQKSGSASPSRASDGHGSRSESPTDDKSNNSEKNVGRSQSGSPAGNENRKSRSRSVGSNNSRQSSSRTGSGSDNDSQNSKEQSVSPSRESGAIDKVTDDDEDDEDDDEEHSPKKRVGSEVELKKSRSRSGSDSDNNSNKEVSAKSSKSQKSGTNSLQKSRSDSPHSERSRSPQEKNINSHHSRSGSPLSGSGSDNEQPAETPKKRKRAVLSDDSASENEKKNNNAADQKDDGDDSEKDLVIDAEALFGDASDISSDEEGRKKKAIKKGSDNEGKQSHDEENEVESQKGKSEDEDVEMEEDEKEEDKENMPEEPQPETRIDVEIPKITTNLGKDIHFVKLPNFLSVETRPFDPSTYEDEIDEEETLDEEGRARLKLKVENTIRWKEITKQNGEFDKQSNARFVKWSDGSMSLHLGSEIFDVYKQPLQGDHNHLFIRQGTGLQGQAVFRTKLTFRPHSTESFTHRKMTMSLADRSQKTAGIKVLSLVGKDPEAHRGELIKKEEERLKASVRRESKQRRLREKGAHRGLSTGYLEPDRYGDMDSDDDGISINAIKKQHKNKMINSRDDRSHIYSSDEEGSDIETRRAKRLDKAKALKDSDSEGSGAEEGGGGEKSGERTSSGED